MLTYDEQLESLEAAKGFKKECIEDDYKVKAMVYVCEPDGDEDDYLFKVSVDVQIDMGTNTHKVHIMWEQELGENFKQKDNQIYGTYNTDWNFMEYNYRELTFTSQNRKIIIQA
jgi:hypothetical protein